MLVVLLTNGHPSMNACIPCSSIILSLHLPQNTCGHSVHLTTFLRMLPQLLVVYIYGM